VGRWLGLSCDKRKTRGVHSAETASAKSDGQFKPSSGYNTPHPYPHPTQTHPFLPRRTYGLPGVLAYGADNVA
jgi:hypothetical protein